MTGPVVAAGRRRAGPTEGTRRRLGSAVSAVHERRAEILALAYCLGALGMLCAWAADPAGVSSRIGVAVPVILALCGSVLALLLRHRVPAHTEDVAIVASLVLVPVAAVSLSNASLLQPYYVWVGFASPLWFPTRRSVAYLLLTGVAAGAEAASVGTRAALAIWFVTMATVVLAFLAVHFLTRIVVGNERLAAVGEMASAIGHELRNPLGAVTNALYLTRVALGEPLAPEVERQLQLAERETARAVSIADDMRAFVRPRRTVPAPVDVASLVSEVLESTPPPPGVDVELGLHPVTLAADRDQLAEVLTNLLQNAYEAMPDGGTIHLGAADELGRVLLTVADSGVGMDEETSSRVFEPFFTTRAKGTGLGLAIVERLVEEHGGTIGVQSVPGQGTRVSIRLPRHPPKRPVDGAIAPEWPR